MTSYVFPPVLLTGTADPQGNLVPLSNEREYRKFTVYNSTGVVVTLKVYLVPDGAAVGATTQVLDMQIEDGDTDPLYAIIGSKLTAKGRLHASGVGLSFSYVAEDSTV